MPSGIRRSRGLSDKMCASPLANGKGLERIISELELFQLDRSFHED